MSCSHATLSFTIVEREPIPGRNLLINGSQLSSWLSRGMVLQNFATNISIFEQMKIVPHKAKVMGMKNKEGSKEKNRQNLLPKTFT